MPVVRLHCGSINGERPTAALVYCCLKPASVILCRMHKMGHQQTAPPPLNMGHQQTAAPSPTLNMGHQQTPPPPQHTCVTMASCICASTSFMRASDVLLIRLVRRSSAESNEG
jgi:hypothetical protein